MTLFWTILGAIVYFFALASCHDHDHDLTHEQLINNRGCGTSGKTEELMNRNPEYKRKHDLEHKRADRYVAKMKKRKELNDRPFVKKLSKTNTKTSRSRNGRGLMADNSSDSSEVVIRIPIVYHILYSKDSENLSDEQLDSQISVLNRDYGAYNDEISSGEVDQLWQDRVGDSKFEFYKNRTYRVSISSSEAVCLNESIMKNTSNGGSSAVDPKYFLNVWVCDISSAGLLGYAYPPCMFIIYFFIFCIFCFVIKLKCN